MPSNEIVTAIQKATRYDALVATLFDGAKFETKITPYDQDDIYIDCFDVRLLLKAFEPDRYLATVELAKAKAELAKTKAEEKMRIREADTAEGATDCAAD